MGLTAGDIRKTLSSLDGKTFSNRDELENAVLPLFGPLQTALPGYGYRDLIDMLINKKWIVWDRGNGTHIVKFPPTPPTRQETEETPLTTTTEKDNSPDTTLTLQEISVILKMHPGNPYSGPEFESLIEKNIVGCVASVAMNKPDSNQIKNSAITALLEDDFKKAYTIISAFLNEQNVETIKTYKLTELGVNLQKCLLKGDFLEAENLLKNTKSQKLIVYLGNETHEIKY